MQKAEKVLDIISDMLMSADSESLASGVHRKLARSVLRGVFGKVLFSDSNSLGAYSTVSAVRRKVFGNLLRDEQGAECLSYLQLMKDGYTSRVLWICMAGPLLVSLWLNI